MRMVMLTKRGCCLVALAIALIGFNAAGTAADTPLNVYVVNYPLKYFAERIGGQQIEVTFPVPPDVDPAYWNPGIAEIGGFQQADLILLNGAGYAKWVGNVSLPPSKTVDTSAKFQEQFIYAKEVMTHSHGAEGEHAHEALAFTTWLDLSLATEQAQAIYKAMARKRPQQKNLFKENYQSLKNDLMEIDSHIRELTSQNSSTPIIFSHPVYDYLAKRYSINGRSVHWEPHVDPTPMQIAELKDIKNTHSAKWMIWEGQPLESIVNRLKAMGIGSVVFDPCGNIPSTGDFVSVMLENVKNIELIYRQ